MDWQVVHWSTNSSKKWLFEDGSLGSLVLHLYALNSVFCLLFTVSVLNLQAQELIFNRQSEAANNYSTNKLPLQHSE